MIFSYSFPSIFTSPSIAATIFQISSSFLHHQCTWHITTLRSLQSRQKQRRRRELRQGKNTVCDYFCCLYLGLKNSSALRDTVELRDECLLCPWQQKLGHHWQRTCKGCNVCACLGVCGLHGAALHTSPIVSLGVFAKAKSSLSTYTNRHVTMTGVLWLVNESHSAYEKKVFLKEKKRRRKGDMLLTCSAGFISEQNTSLSKRAE